MHDMHYLSSHLCHPKTVPYQSDDQHVPINAGQFPFFPILIPIHVNHKNRDYTGKLALLSKEWETMGQAHFERLRIFAVSAPIPQWQPKTGQSQLANWKKAIRS